MEDVPFDVGETTLENFTENPDIPDAIVEEAISEDTKAPQTSTSEPEIIGTINSAAYGGFVKILSLLTSNAGKTDIISIEKGKLSLVSGGGFLYCDLSMLFGENNFDIIDPQYSIKLLKLISGGEQVTFIDDNANSTYLISNLVDGNPQINIKLPKPDPSLNPKITSPNLGELQEEVHNIDPDLVNTITSAEKNLESQYFILEIAEDPEDQKEKIISISTDQETFKFNFKDSWKADDGQEPTKYKLFNPFPVPKPDEIQFELYKSEAGELWVKTVSEVGMAKIDYMEKLTPMGMFDTFGF